MTLIHRIQRDTTSWRLQVWLSLVLMMVVLG